MGASTYEEMQHGKTAKEAFHRAVERAQYEYGHGGYTGTIAEKYDFTEFTLPPRVMARKVLANLYSAMTPEAFNQISEFRKVNANDRRALKAYEWLAERLGPRVAVNLMDLYNDKWGPAVAFKVTGATRDQYVRWNGKLPRGHSVYLFCGFASC
jgi:hypothetical protein